MAFDNSETRALRIADDNLADVLAGRTVLLEDGGMGSLLMATGALAAGALPDSLNAENPAAVTGVQARYAQAGSQLVVTNTFSSDVERLGSEDAVAASFAAAAKVARAAGVRYVGGDIGPASDMLDPYGELEEDDAFDSFALQARSAAAAGCDVIAIETMTDLNMAALAVRAACASCDLPVFVTMSFGESGRTLFGNAPADCVRALVEAGASAVGCNCSLGPAEMLPVVQQLVEACREAGVPCIAKPNAGLPRVVNGETVYDVDPEAFAQAMRAILDAGATIVGGCCGTTPDHIAALAAVL